MKACTRKKMLGFRIKSVNIFFVFYVPSFFCAVVLFYAIIAIKDDFVIINIPKRPREVLKLGIRPRVSTLPPGPAHPPGPCEC